MFGHGANIAAVADRAVVDSPVSPISDAIATGQVGTGIEIRLALGIRSLRVNAAWRQETQGDPFPRATPMAVEPFQAILALAYSKARLLSDAATSGWSGPSAFSLIASTLCRNGIASE